ncbi:RNA polymerase sigma factor RpoE [Aliidiomarina shirensis]|uniref:RNA polymerase sigma factor n=2 Tax=Aliidiomarina TaxID=1249554 RepID=A0A432W0H5_9GAMM|nr:MULTISPECIES: RNA polymerase sigma factor RpoE [Aliidiomarina]RUO22520.1 RNA polymerase sigma factor RpoE [Aliidiomarina iranensis]RUO38224.1 RNA polymerase sigma factor RpoE [Aliidiomarina shirensis]
MSEQEIDQQLVERVQRGDQRAFDVLVKKYQHKIISLVSRYVKHPGDVPDVAQEAFIKAYRALPNFRGESAFYTWLYRIAVNTAKNYLVARGRKPPSSDVDAQDAEFLDAGHGLRDIASPERMLLSDELKRTVMAAIDALPDDLKQAITLRELDGMGYEEIAITMDCPIGTVRSRIFRAREAIDKAIEPLLDAN